MAQQATYEDVNLILRLYEMRREEKMRAARGWFLGNFKPKSLAEMQQLCPPGSDANAFMRQTVSYWDMVASFVTSGVLNQELFFQSGAELLNVWVRIEPILPEVRAAFKNPGTWANLEKVGKAFADHLGPDVYAGFVARVRG